MAPLPWSRFLEEQRQRWQGGERPLVEEWLSRDPALAADREALLDFIYQEILLRENQGERPSLDEYQRRFPALTLDLAAQFEVESALDGVDLAATADGLSEMGKSTDAEAASSWPAVRAEQLVADDPIRFVRVPDYEILGVLGRGGMGVVYKARQISLNRPVALKMILAGEHTGPHQLKRFRTEAEAAARLQHPNIVQVHEFGVCEGRPFLALELVEENLSRKLAGTPVSARQAAQWLETLAGAVHHAHRLGVIHRDLKPANVLIGCEGTLKIADFGMARIVTRDGGSQTQTGAILGTPSYMAPEQASGNAHSTGPATDVYGLGTILYELLTGRPPFRAPTVFETLEQVRVQEPIPPGRLQPGIPRDLETICLICLHKEPERRYVSVEALANDLNAFLAGQPIRSRRIGSVERLARWARGHPAEAALFGTGILGLLSLAAGVLWSHALAFGAVAVMSLPFAGWLYHTRLQRAILELRQQQVVAERSAQRLKLLLELTRDLMRPTQLGGLLRLLAETTAWLAKAELATIYILDPQRRELYSQVTLDQAVGEIRLPLGVGIAGTVAATGQPINVPDAYTDPRFNSEIDQRTGHKTRNLLTVPITAADGSIRGVFQVMNKQNGTFDIDDIEILSSLAASASVAIEHASARGDA